MHVGESAESIAKLKDNLRSFAKRTFPKEKFLDFE